MNKDEILELLPQRPPMVMIEGVLSADAHSCRSFFSVDSGHLFCENGRFEAAGLVENMAQTAAAHAGYLARKEQKSPPAGYIAGIKNLQIVTLPVVGEQIETEISLQHQVMNFRIIAARVFCKEAEIACCEMKILVNERE